VCHEDLGNASSLKKAIGEILLQIKDRIVGGSFEGSPPEKGRREKRVFFRDSLKKEYRGIAGHFGVVSHLLRSRNTH